MGTSKHMTVSQIMTNSLLFSPLVNAFGGVKYT